MLLNLTVFFALLGSACVKAACRTLVKLTPDQRKSTGEKAASKMMVKLTLKSISCTKLFETAENCCLSIKIIEKRTVIKIKQDDAIGSDYNKLI